MLRRRWYVKPVFVTALVALFAIGAMGRDGERKRERSGLRGFRPSTPKCGPILYEKAHVCDVWCALLVASERW